MVVHFEPIDRSMIYTADELILTGTAAQFAFAESVDERQIGNGLIRGSNPGPICTLLRCRFDDVISKRDPKLKEWITTFKQEGEENES